METFLQMVARDLFHKTGGDLSHTAVVFPNKRAGLFFNECLARQTDRPLWSPAYLTISDLFRQLSPLKAGDPIRLVCELYRVFRQETGSQETLDDFYFWGELLISDFDDADKNLVDTDRLFANLQDLHALADHPDFLTPEQGEALQQFFQHFSIEQRTELKQRFISLWDKLGIVYTRYCERLSQLGIAYEGMLYRRVIDEMDPECLPYERYAFVGFNVLNRVESRFFQQLRDAGKALFYWDYDTAYTTLPLRQDPPYTHEAGEFILRNLRHFPNELPESCFDILRRPKTVSLISAPTENAQARFLPQWVRQIKAQSAPDTPEQENAVVLCNEALLLPVLHSIPSEVRNVNITMGFPLAQTPIYGFLNALAALQTEGYRPQTGRYDGQAVLAVLRHPYTRRMSPAAESLEKRLLKDNRFYPLPSELAADNYLQALFAPLEGTDALCRYLADQVRRITVLYRQEDEGKDDIFSQLYRESLFRAYTLVNRLLNLTDTGLLDGLRADTLRRLLDRLLKASNIPFHGEPAIGMQVMGVLETRNLDFRNVLVLSLNEGQLPKAGGEASFIPYNLRRAFGMTTIEHKNAVYAYYFYRLIQRAEHITLLYNTSTDGLNRGEMSRFALQFLVEYRHPIGRYYLETGQSPRRVNPITVQKTPSVTERLCRRFDTRRSPDSVFSPSAFNAYLDCSLMFYYRYVAGLRMPDEVSADIDSALFGTIFHRSAEWIYRDLTIHSKDITKTDLEALLKDDARLQGYVDRAFKKELFHVAANERPEYNGTQLVHAKVIASYLRQLLRNDLRYAPFRMEEMEKEVRETWNLETKVGRIEVNLGGTIDRMDSKGDTLRIVDYKTGGQPKTPEGIEQLFTPAFGRPGYIFQTFLYAAILCRQQGLKVAPALLYIHKAAAEDYEPIIQMGPARQKMPVNNFAFHETEFRQRLQALLQEIFDPDTPFVQTEDERRCAYCDYRGLCRR